MIICDTLNYIRKLTNHVTIKFYLPNLKADRIACYFIFFITLSSLYDICVEYLLFSIILKVLILEIQLKYLSFTLCMSSNKYDKILSY